MTRYIALLSFFASWMIPVHFLPWVSWHNELLAFFAVMLIGWWGVHELVIRRKLRSVPIPVATIPFLVLGLIVGTQKAAGLITFGGDAMVICFYAVLCIICLSSGHSLGAQISVRSAENKAVDRQTDLSTPAIHSVAIALLLAAFISTFVAFCQVLNLWEGVDWMARMSAERRPGANLGQPNHLATLILMGIASLLYLGESKKITAIAAFLLLFALTAGLALTESRTGVLSYFTMLIWYVVKRRKVGLRLPAWVAISSVFGFLTMFYTWPALLDFINSLDANTKSTVSTAAGARLLVWPQLFEAVQLKPWLGWGFGRTSEALTAVVHVYPVSEAFTYSHNIVLDIAVGAGLPLAFIAVVATVRWTWRRLKWTNQLLPWYGVAVVIPIAVHSMLEFPFAYAYFLAPVTFFLGVVDGLYSPRSVFRFNSTAAAASLFTATALMAWSVAEYVAVEEDFRIVRFEALRVGVTPSTYERPQLILLTQLDALLFGGRIKPNRAMTSDEIDLARKVALRFPWPALQNRYALSLALNQNPAEAIRMLKVMRAMHGQEAYSTIFINWQGLGRSQFPELLALVLPLPEIKSKP